MKTPIYYTIVNKGNNIENTIFQTPPNTVSDFDRLDVMRYLPSIVDISEICLLAEAKKIPEFKKSLDFILNKFETYTFNIVNDLIENNTNERRIIKLSKVLVTSINHNK